MAEVPTWIGISLKDRYEIQSLLGSGGMSAVYKAFDKRLKRTVAVKLIHPHLANEKTFINRFEAEAAAIASLNHPNIVGVYDFDHHGNTYYMVMEYIEGQTLGDEIEALQERDQRMSYGKIIELMANFCDTVDYAHRKGVIHRDLKPANVMILPDGTPELMDFGIAKIAQSDSQTATGVVVGTVAYISPEQILGKDIDHRVDIYALGVILYELLSGRRPFDADTTLAVMRQHLDEPPPSLDQVDPSIPRGFSNIVETALQKEKQNRYATAAEMAKAIRAINLTPTDLLQPRGFDPTMLMETGGLELEEDTTRRHEVSAASLTTSERPTPELTRPHQAPTSWSRFAWGGGILLLLVLAFGFGFQFMNAADNGLAFLNRIDPESDEDGDGLTYAVELEIGTDPTSSDTDGDSFPDSAERGEECLDPLNPDSDGDGINDGIDEDPCVPATPDRTIQIKDIVIVAGENLRPTEPPAEGNMYDSYGSSTDMAGDSSALADDDRLYEVTFEAIGFEPKVNDYHIHFFYDTVPVEEAGQPGAGPWRLHQNSQTVKQFTIADSPEDAQALCAIVSTFDHRVDPRTAVCFPLPER